MNIKFQIARFIYLVILIIMLTIFIGMNIRGFLDLLTIIIPFDYVFAILYFLVGLYFALKTIKEIARSYKGNGEGEKYLKNKWQKNSTYIWISIFVFLIIYLFRFEIQTFILFAGYEVATIIIRAASNAYLEIFQINLYSMGYYKAAWIFQFHFIFALVVFAVGIGRGITNLFKKKNTP